MTPEERAELGKALNHALVTGEAYMVDGKFVDPKEIYKDTADLRAEKIVPEHADVDVKWLRNQIAAEIRAAVEEAKREKQDFYDASVKDIYREGKQDGLEEAAKVADTEEELDGLIPQTVIDATLKNPENSLRATCRATKKSIAQRIRAIKDCP